MKFIPVPASTEYQAVMEKLLDAGIVMVHLIPGLLGVKVPAAFKSQPILRLNFSYRFGISDFMVDERGVRASLSFGGVNHFCDIPWGAVLAISSTPADEMYVWVENFSLDQLEPILPPPLLAQLRAFEAAGLLDEDKSEDDEKEASKDDEKEASKDDEENKKEDSEDDSEEDSEDDDEKEDSEDDGDDDVPPGGWGPLRLV